MRCRRRTPDYDRTMVSICFVCNRPILSYQVGLIWTGGNGWDDLMREQVQEATLKQRLGTGRRDSATQISPIEPEPPSRRRRSSIAQWTDLLREWGGGGASGKSGRGKLRRRETLADIAKSMPWSRQTTTDASHLERLRKRRESSVDSGIRSQVSSKWRAELIDLKNDLAKHWSKKEPQPPPAVISPTPRRGSGESKNSRRGSGESTRYRRDSGIAAQIPSPGERKHNCRHHRRRQSQQSVDSGAITPTKYRNDHGVGGFSTDSTASSAMRDHLKSRQSFDRSSSVETKTHSSEGKILTPTTTTTTLLTVDGKSNEAKVTICTSSTTTITLTVDTKLNRDGKNLSLDSSTPTIVMSSVTPPSVSPTTGAHTLFGGSALGSSSPITTPTHPLQATRRDSTTQCYYKGREASPNKLSRLTRQAAAVDETMQYPPLAVRRGSQPTLSSDADDGGRKARRDSLSPDSASYPRRRDSRSHLSPDRAVDKRDISPSRHHKPQLRKQSTSMAGWPPRSESSSCSSRDPSPCARPSSGQSVPVIRKESATQEIMTARGFRRQSTTEEMIRCRNFRRGSSQSDEPLQRRRRDSSAQIINGTFDSMTVETFSNFFDSSTQTEPSPLYDNNHYHEECLRCDCCHQDLTGPNQKRARRYKNRILCDLHFPDVALMECSDFMQQLRSFKNQSLGCAVARRKSSTTLIFPLPPQACSDEFCVEFPHNLIATPGYWIECSRQQVLSDTLWDESGSGDATDPDQGEDGQDSSKHDSNYCNYNDDVPRKKTAIEEQWEKKEEFELTSVEQETYEKYFHSDQHWNYFSIDDELGPVILSIKQEMLSGRDQFRILVRGTSYTVHGLIPVSCVFADRYNRDEVVRSLGKEVNINPPFTLGQLPGTPDELLKLDKVFIKSELKVGVIYVREGQYSEEEILDNNENSPLFEEFLQLLGERVRLKDFDKYKGGLDTAHDLTGLYSVYTKWRGIEIMFHVSTLLPYEKHDPQKLQRKRHIGNDIVCVVFLEADNTNFSPACIKSHFLHTFILVRVSPRIKRKITRYAVSVVTRDEVGAYKPYLWEQSVFDKGPMFREWLLTKIVNGERASYSAPKFARMQERTRSQMLKDIVSNLANHAETGKIPLPYRRGSWRPGGHTRPSSPLLDSFRERFEHVDQLVDDFTRVFLNNQENIAVNGNLFDVSFLVGEKKPEVRLMSVRAILATRSRVFKEMLYGITDDPRSSQVPDNEFLARPAPTLLSPQKLRSSNYLQVPEVETPRPKSVPSSPMVKRAWSRLTDVFGRSIRKHGTLQNEDRKRWASSHDFSNDTKEKEKAAPQLALPRLSFCADVHKVDRAKLAQTEFMIKEFDPETVRILLDYLHTGSCPLTCVNVPGLISAAEHYDLPDLLNACFHHAKQFLTIDVVCVMLCSLEPYHWRYSSATDLEEMILAFIDARAGQLFEKPDFLSLSESMVQTIMSRDIDVAEIKKFEAMLSWAKHKVESESAEAAAKEFKSIMQRLSQDLKLYMIHPEELITIVLRSRAIENNKIMDTLMVQAKTGIYRNVDLEACRKEVQTEESVDYDI